jgi:hypothetical protein
MLLKEVQYPMGLFSGFHIIFLVVFWGAAAFLAFFLSKKFGYSKKVVWICAILGMLCEVQKIYFFLEDTGSGYRFPAAHLPLNMCPFQILLMFVFIASENPKKQWVMLSFMYPTMVGGGFIGTLIPSAAISYHGLLEFATYRYFFFHAMLIFLGLYFFLSKPVQFKIKSFGVAVVFIFTMVIFAVWLNAFFGWDPEVNFWFIVRPPVENIPILNFNNGWWGYMSQLLWICMSLFVLCYLPVFIKETPELVKKIKEKLRSIKK